MSTQSLTRPVRWPDYRAVWRWHFYAGLFCIPFVCFLAVTGSIYLFKPQVEAWLDRPYDHRPVAQTASPSRVVAAALAANPGWTLHDYELPVKAQSAARVILGRNGDERRVYVDRGTLSVLKTVREDDRLMRVIFRLHGELLMGDRGSMVVELAASWAIIMIVTGLYLWWPRQAVGLAGLLYPRLNAGRLVWRDLHAVIGLWVSLFALLLLFSGLPWAKNWGGYLKEVRRLAGGSVAHQDWTTGRSSEIAARRSKDASGAMAGMADMPGMDAGVASLRKHQSLPLSTDGLAALDRMAPTLAALHLPPPVLLSPPTHPNGPWAGRSDAQNRPLRVNVQLDPVTGNVMSRTNFNQRPLVDRIVGVGVAGHEGQLFGLANQLLGVLVAISLITLSVSAVVLWWRRRAFGVLGAPIPDRVPRFSPGLVAIVIALAVLLPEFGASVLLVLVVERLILRRLPSIAAWLGLRLASI